DELLAAIKDPKVDAFKYLADKLMDPTYPGSIPWYQKVWQQNADIVHSYGLDLVAYEGGQHVHEKFKTKGLSTEDIQLLSKFLAEFVRSEEMGELYKANWAAWAAVSDGPMMQFNDLGTAGQYGSWGLRTNLEDNNPRALALDEL